jgi:hypothetical protein
VNYIVLLILKNKIMKGINYLTNDKGVKTALVIDLKFYKNHVEDFLDIIKAEANRHEETIPLREALKIREKNAKV